MNNKPRILVLGGGTGGTLVANLLAKKLRSDEAEITLLSASSRHLYQPGWLYVPFGWQDPRSLSRSLKGLLNKRVKLEIGTVSRLELEQHRVRLEGSLEARTLEYDYLVIATPLTPDTRKLIGARSLALLPRGAGLINIGRAPVVDYPALAALLASDHLCGAMLDVFDTEPLPVDAPWWNTPNLVVTPHVSCDAPDYVQRVFDAWNEACGTAWRARAVPVLFRGGQLTLEVASSLDLAELKNFRGQGFRTRANTALGQALIHKLAFKLRSR